MIKRRSLNSGSRKYANNLVLDSVVVFVVLFIFVIFGLVSFNFFTDIKTDLVDEDEDFLDNDSKEIIDNAFVQFPLWLDGIVVTALLLFWVVLLGLTFVIDTHPIIWGIVLLILIFVIFFAAVLSNSYYEISMDDDLYAQSSQLTKTQWIMDRLPFLIVMIFISLVTVILMKTRL